MPARPDILDTNTIAALEKLRAADFLIPADAAVLIEAARLQQALTQILRIALDETPNVEDATPGLKALLTRAAEAGKLRAGPDEAGPLQTQARDIFNRIMNSNSLHGRP